MEQLELEAVVRTEKGTSRVKRLRSQGLIPGIIYSGSEKSMPISVKEMLLGKILKKGENIIVALKIKQDEKELKKTALIKEVQHDPVTSKIMHVDFHLISLKKKIEIKVSLLLVGESVGVKRGGIVEYHVREIPIKCLPTAIPGHIEVNISELDIGDSIHVANLRVPEGIEILYPKEEVILTITPPSEIKEEVVKEVTPTEPEVIGEKEREERRTAKETQQEEKKKEEPKSAKTS